MNEFDIVQLLYMTRPFQRLERWRIVSAASGLEHKASSLEGTPERSRAGRTEANQETNAELNLVPSRAWPWKAGSIVGDARTAEVPNGLGRIRKA